MPRRIQPPSLREASLQSIASNYRYWCVKQSESMPSYTSPFQDLRDDMIQEVMELLKPFGSKRIDFLFHPNLRRLSLIGELPFINNTIHVIGTNCQNLTHLFLAGVGTTCTPEMLCHLVSSLPHLVSLGLQYTSTDHTVLKAIAENCPKLLELDVRVCHGLRSSDFLLLCNQPEHPRLCPQLSKLFLFLPESRSSVPILVALLNTHRNMECVDNCDIRCKTLWMKNGRVSINEVFDQMYGQEYQLKKDVQKEWIRNLVGILIRGRKDESLDLNLTILCCPYLTTLHLNLCDGRLNSLGIVSTLKFLTDFRVFGSTFRGDIDTVLEKIGGNLTHLEFLKTDKVCICRIGELCPNLQYLCLSLTTPASFSTSSSIAQHFSQLQSLYIKNCPELKHAVPIEALSLMLENATEITKLHLQYVGNLTDRIISQADKKHGFRFLTEATFLDCQSISKETGIILLNDSNPLQKLTCYGCDFVMLEHSRDLSEYAKRKRFNVRLEIP